MTLRAKIAIGILALLVTIGVALSLAVYSLQDKITQRLERGWVLPPLELYSQGVPLSLGRKFDLAAVEREIRARDLSAGRDYEILDTEACATTMGLDLKEPVRRCYWFRREPLLVATDENDFIQAIWRGEPLEAVSTYALFPRLITQFYGNRPILQQNTPLAEIPLYCLQAVTAIEDRDFLEHRGVSPTGILRAIVRNARAGRWAEGGSTITQQLVKNFFLNPKKTIRRKLQEQLLAVMLESQITKDQILEMYLNVIYMGQNGPYQVLGFGSAARHYFDKPIGKLDLAECALMGALVNSPGRYSPFEHPDSARARRELVLAKMTEENMISADEASLAARAPLPAPSTEPRAHAPYFVLTALREFESLNLDAENGARLFTTLDPDAQVAMASGINKVLPAVEKRVKKPSKQPLQVAAITVDLASAQVLALTGGRDFRSTQYNRAFDSRRQIGSIVKPFVYLPAIEDGKDPLSPVVDEPFTWKIGRNSWNPRNYDGKMHGTVPYFLALAQSLNIPAAKIGQEVGLDSIARTIARAGIAANVPRLPSLTLGAFELSLWEVAQGFTTIGRFGVGDRIHTLRRVEDPRGEVIYQREPESGIELDRLPTAVLVGMMRQSLEVGTARAARAWGLEGSYAGKTGTTSDTKDAWFVGFDAHQLTVVWVGYDDNTPMGLTGASAALPVWVEIAKSYQPFSQRGQFVWPEGVELRSVPRDEILEKYPSLTGLPEFLSLTFANWAY